MDIVLEEQGAELVLYAEGESSDAPAASSEPGKQMFIGIPALAFRGARGKARAGKRKEEEFRLQ